MTYSFKGKGPKQKETAKKLEDHLILPFDEARLFWKTLREEFKIDEPLAIRRATSAEWSNNPYKEEFENNDFPPPNLAGLSVLFIVDGNKSRFMVLVRNEPEDDMRHFEPVVSWVEIMPEK